MNVSGNPVFGAPTTSLSLSIHYMCIYTYIHIYIYIYTHTCVYNTCVYIYIYTHISISLSLYIYIYTHIYLSLSLSLYIYIYNCFPRGRRRQGFGRRGCARARQPREGPSVRRAGRGSRTASLRIRILDFIWLDSGIMLMLRGGIPRPMNNFLESLSQQILVLRFLVWRLAVGG